MLAGTDEEGPSPCIFRRKLFIASSLSFGFFRLLLRFLRFLALVYSAPATPLASVVVPLSTILDRSVRLLFDESRGSCSRTLSALAAFDEVDFDTLLSSVGKLLVWGSSTAVALLFAATVAVVLLLVK